MVASVAQIREVNASHQRLRGMVSEMILLSYSPDNDAKVLPQFARRMVETLGARSGAIWTCGAGGAFVCVGEHQSKEISTVSLASLRPAKATLSKYALSSVGGIVAMQHASVARAGINAPLAQVAIIVPIHLNGAPWGVIELLPSGELTEKAQREALNFVRHMARVLSHRAAMHGTLHSQPRTGAESSSPQILTIPIPQQVTVTKPPTAPPAAGIRRSDEQRHFEVVRALHESLDLEATGFVIANEFRQVLRCDRVSVAVVRGSACRLMAVSSQDTIHRRADVVRQLEQLATLALDERSPIWLKSEPEPADTEKLSPKLVDAVNEHRELCAWQQLGIIPLRSTSDANATGPARAMLIVEQMHDAPHPQMPTVAAQLAPHAAQALIHALEQEQILLLPFWKSLGRIRHSLMATSRRKLSTIASGLLFGTMFLAFFPVGFHVQGRGALQPVAQHDVFAEVDGIVTAIHVEHGTKVQEGDILLELRNTDLDVRIAEILGQRRSAQEQLGSLQRMRHVEHISREEQNRLTGQVLQLQEELKGLDEQQKLLLKKKERLIVRSPMSGQVSTWNVQRQLMLRPVMTGQVLLTIADGNGPWNLEVYLPEGEAGHVMAANSDKKQAVEYLVSSEPTVTHVGEVARIDATAQLYEEHGHAVRVLVKVNKHDLPDTPAGTTATASILCGTRSIGYVWLHRLIDFVHTRILFPLF